MLDMFYVYIVFPIFALPCIANPVDLDALIPLNSTKDFNTNNPYTPIVNTTNALEGLIGCFRQASPDEPQLSRTSFIDCFHAVEKMSAHDTRSLVYFRRNNDSSFILPNYFTYRTCIIFLDMVSDDAVDFFYIGEVRDVAIDIARRCTALPMALGGKGMAGPRKLMEVEVLGRL